MKINGKNALKILQENAARFDPESEKLKSNCLKVLASQPLPPYTKLIAYHDLLLFLLAHPGSEQLVSQTEKELGRITTQLKKQKRNPSPALESSGLPYTHTVTSFSHDITVWMLQQEELSLSIHSMNDKSENLNSLLKLTLPSPERYLTALEYNSEELFDVLQIKAGRKLDFLIGQLSPFNDRPLLKDHLFEKLEMELDLRSKKKDFSRSYNRFLLRPVFYHTEIIKKFDHRTLLNTPVPEATNLSLAQRSELIKTIRYSLLLMARETDPATYLDENSLRYIELERGIAIAVYGMTKARQLPLESYVGYTLFKNGFPAAYGGSWVFGSQALFGMNIFESFRGGESGYMMCQLLRTYRQLFSISNFEVEPYQFGKNNPDGIRSGAFWFYYRFGFRPLDLKLKKLAESEHHKIATQNGYRSSYEIMERFTESYINLEIEPVKQASVIDFTWYITSMISSKHKGNRSEAEQYYLQKYNLKTTPAGIEFALLAGALNIVDEKLIDLIRQLATAKANNLYQYQTLLLRLLQHPVFVALT